MNRLPDLAEFTEFDVRDVYVPSDSTNLPYVLRFWRSRDFVVVLVHTPETAWPRLSVMRSAARADVHRTISWAELMAVKETLGFGHRVALELYPATRDAINTTNGRHLWLLPEGDLPDWLDFNFTDGKIDLDRAAERRD